MVGIRTMEFCRRWDIVRNVEASPYPRDYPQDNVYLTSLNGWELGRAPFPAMNQDMPPPTSPQKRERCPQNMFDPILREFAASQAGVELRYRTRMVSFREEGRVRRRRTRRCRERRAQQHPGAFPGRVRRRGQQGPSRSRHRNDRPADRDLYDERHFPLPRPRRHARQGQSLSHIFVGPDGTWGTIVAITAAISGACRSSVPRIARKARREAEIRAAIRRAAGFDFEYEILSVMPWVRRELVG